MGLTIRCKKTGRAIDMGCGGFFNLRCEVAELCGKAIGDHYNAMRYAPFLSPAREEYFTEYDRRTEQLVNDGTLDIKIADFLYQSDCEGRIRYGACKNLLKAIGDYDDDVIYGYAGWKHPAMFRDFVAILKDCVKNRCDMIWD